MILPAALLPMPIRMVNQLIADGRVPFLPVSIARGPHGLGGVIMAVKVMQVDVRTHEGAGRFELHQVFETAVNLRSLINAGTVQRDYPRRTPGKLGDAAKLLIAESTLPVLTVLDVAGAAVDGGFRHVKASVTGGTQGHDLANGHRDVGVSAA